MKKAALIMTGCLLALSFVTAFASDPEKREVSALRVEEGIKIDGQLDEASWLTADRASGFVQFSPNPGAAGSQKSEVYLLYDNNAIYVGAILYDTHPDSILKEMSERDRLGNTDYFGIIIDAYQDGLNGVGFFVTPTGIQYDIKYSALNGRGGGVRSGDTNWDAVWDSRARITPEGWMVEMKIPYAAIRFPNREEQVWNINLFRSIRRSREDLFWNAVKPEIDGLLNQSGAVVGIKDIKSPVRLSATPFVVGYVEQFHDKEADPVNTWGRSLSGGMDIKYGINDAFTLDMTLVPDFGEARSDNQVLNLSPFEVRFDENRQFFTEGVELFNKGNLFYSRRVGGRPLDYFEVEDWLEEGDSILINPSTTQLINATKVSGRTNGGLGVGVFNATAAQSEAVILNQEDDQERRVQTSPLTNYNVTVFDQNLKNNSFVTLLNTNVWRNGSDYDANVTGTVFSFRNKDNSYAVGGNAVVSQLYSPGEVELGHKYSLEVEKTSGNIQWSMRYNVESDTYDHNDLGFLFNNNERSFSGSLNYNRFEPFGPFNRGGVGIWMGYSRLYNPSTFTDFGINIDGFLITKSFFAFGLWTYHELVSGYDYFEPRVEGRYFRVPTSNNVGGWLSTDYRKKFAIDVRGNFRKFNEDGRYRANISVEPRYRFNDRFNLRFEVGSFNSIKDLGYTTKTGENEDVVIFGRRDQLTFENTLNASYAFTANMILTFRLRHYWSAVDYEAYYLLAEDGTMAETSYSGYHNNSFDAFNIDAIYRWRFAPGSDIFIIWKNAILSFADIPEDVHPTYWDSLRGLNDLPQSNSLSIKVIYFLDYLNFVKS